MTHFIAFNCNYQILQINQLILSLVCKCCQSNDEPTNKHSLVNTSIDNLTSEVRAITLCGICGKTWKE